MIKTKYEQVPVIKTPVKTCRQVQGCLYVEDHGKQYVLQNGKLSPCPDEGVLREDVRSALKTAGNEAQRADGTILYRFLPAGLQTRLAVYSKAYGGSYNQTNGLRLLGFKTAWNHCSTTTLADELRGIITEEMARDAYENRRHQRVKNFLFEHSDRAKSIYIRFHNRGQGLLQKAINSLYPALTEQYRLSLWDALDGKRSHSELSDIVQERFLTGGDLSSHVMRNEGYGLPEQIMDLGKPSLLRAAARNGAGRRQLNTPANKTNDSNRGTKTKHDAVTMSVPQISDAAADNFHLSSRGGGSRESLYGEGFQSYVKSLGVERNTDTKNELRSDAAYKAGLAKLLAPLGVASSDILASYDGRKLLGLATELHLKLLLEIARVHDPDAHEWPRVREMAGSQIHAIEGPSTKGLTLRTDGRQLIGDLRLEAENGSTLIEVKNWGDGSQTNLKKRIMKYTMAREWADTTPIDRRVLFYNNGKTREDLMECEEDGWQIYTSNEYLEDIAKAFQRFGDRLPIGTHLFPLSAQHVLDMSQRLAHQSHVLSRQPHRFLQDWYCESLRTCIAGVSDFSTTPRPLQTFKERTITRFDDVAAHYGGKAPKLNGELFLDFETLGFRNTGAPIITAAMAYACNDALICEQFFLSDPTRERALLERVHERIRESRIVVTFNGTTFDVPMLHERSLANLLPPSKFNHLDLLASGRVYADTNLLSRATLKSVERHAFPRVLKELRRNDVPSGKIPEVYENYLFARQHDGYGVQDIQHHNQLDVFTLAMLYGHGHVSIPASSARAASKK